MMKYHTLSTSSLAAEGKKSTLTIYTQPDFVREKMDSTATALVRCELEMAQRALKLQTRRCRQLVSEFTRKLQAKELEALTERHLRDEQLTKVLRSLLVFEARLKQEQTFIKHQLADKDDIIQRQKKEIKGLRNLVQYCNTCSQYYSPSNIDSCDSNWESGSEMFGSILSEEETHKVVYEKNNKNRDSNYKRCKKLNNHRRMTGTYFEVLKSRESSTESSAEDVSSELSDSLKTKEEIEKVSERIEELFAENSDTFSDKMNSLHGIRKSPETTPILQDNNSSHAESVQDSCLSPVLSNDSSMQESSITEVNSINENLTNEEKETIQNKNRLISETISVFDADDGEHNDSWYASASDQEDDDKQNVYRNNPVLECMNQILLQNINDAIHSPPKSPELDRNIKNKTQKRVKFSDEHIKEASVTEVNIKGVENIDNTPAENNESSVKGDYYETPIQGGANFYEVPQSIYSNDYEQILSKSSDSVHSWKISPNCKLENMQENKINRMSTQKLTIPKCNNLDDVEKSHYYIDMDTTVSVSPRKDKKNKLSRTPPALPPKPANLVSKFKLQNILINRSCDSLEELTVESEPDYCSISELNLPTEKMIMSKSHPIPVPSNVNLNKSTVSLYDPISLDGTLTNLAAQNAEKNSFQTAKQIKNERVANVASIAQINMLKNKHEPEIPKLPQVSEIIIPEENEENKEEHISQDNYIKNNSQILKQKVANSPRNKITIGTSVSSLISNFNSQNVLSFNNRNPERYRLFSNFENQNYEKQSNIEKSKSETPSFEKFDLSQNFEEFNLDDCEIGEEYQSESSNSLTYSINEDVTSPPDVIKEATTTDGCKQETENHNNKQQLKSNTSVEIVRATKDIRPHSLHSLQSLQQLQKNLISQRNNNLVRESDKESNLQVSRNPEPSYEHFLECTGLSSKSILTPSRMLSNHKSMLKPKDIKLRSRVKSSAVFEQNNGTVKYWSEPYL